MKTTCKLYLQIMEILSQDQTCVSKSKIQKDVYCWQSKNLDEY
jgi:hypothetical protein